MTGNQTINNIVYDHRNLSIHTWLDGDVEQIANYNAEGQRILKEVQMPSGTTWDFYVRDGLSTLAVVSNGELQFMNLHGNGTFGRVAANSGVLSASGDKRYYIADLLGSVRAVVDETGDVKENRDYDPWGVPMDQRQYVSGDKALEQFSGQELDEQTGWYHFGQRDLMAIYGRWPSPDRFADKYPSLSPYSYAANDPVGLVDVNGDSVEVAYIWTAPSSFHTLLIHTNEETGESFTIVEGMPNNRVGEEESKKISSKGFGKLEANIVNDDPSQISAEDRETIPIPEGMTEDEFVNKIEEAYQSYDNQVDYAALPDKGKGNSNSLVGSILRAAGSDFNPSRNAPGFNRNVLPGSKRADERLNRLIKDIIRMGHE